MDTAKIDMLGTVALMPSKWKNLVIILFCPQIANIKRHAVYRNCL